MQKVYLELLVDEDVCDELMSFPYPRVAVIKAEARSDEEVAEIIKHIDDEEGKA